MNIKVIYQAAQNKAIAALSRRLPRTPRIFSLLNKLGPHSIVYHSFEEALEACKKLQPEKPNQNSAWLVEANFKTSLRRGPSDYPSLYWLMHVAETQPLRVFDFGGGVGQTFFQYVESLPSGKIEKWIVCDTPEIIAQAQQILGDRQDERLHFTSSLTDSQDCNVFHAAGSLHYWRSTISQFAKELQGFPEHIIINRSPMRLDGSGFITIQLGHDWVAPCMVHNAENLVKEFVREGFELVEQWHVHEYTLSVVRLPEYSSPYQGMYLKRVSEPL